MVTHDKRINVQTSNIFYLHSYFDRSEKPFIKLILLKSINRQIRKIIKSKGCFPNDESVFKLVFLCLQNA